MYRRGWCPAVAGVSTCRCQQQQQAAGCTWSRPLSPTMTNRERWPSLTQFSTKVRMRESTFFLILAAVLLLQGRGRRREGGEWRQRQLAAEWRRAGRHPPLADGLLRGSPLCAPPVAPGTHLGRLTRAGAIPSSGRPVPADHGWRVSVGGWRNPAPTMLQLSPAGWARRGEGVSNCA